MPLHCVYTRTSGSDGLSVRMYTIVSKGAEHMSKLTMVGSCAGTWHAQSEHVGYGVDYADGRQRAGGSRTSRHSWYTSSGPGGPMTCDACVLSPQTVWPHAIGDEYR